MPAPYTLSSLLIKEIGVYRDRLTQNEIEKEWLAKKLVDLLTEQAEIEKQKEPRKK